MSAKLIHIESPTFEDVYHQFHRLIYHIAYKLTKDAHLSEDIVQETFMKAYRKWDTLIDFRKIQAWLSCIANRTAIDFIRKESKRREDPVDDHGDYDSPFIAHSCGMVESELDLHLLEEEIEAGIRMLPASQQEVLRLKAIQGLSDKEIAQKLDLNPATVKTRYHRARKQLNGLLNKSA
ncbi:RNA polymerase sigma factor [Rossellomorea aquimaris]|uniref:RNA polymerase sigma factor n=1 Tax=Rossellomorea aquimaris TaxID=189382 RepID=UPI001CD66C6F|nr:RNA polymerase sigma factor [Rossellomorea aquimaris]MCA1056115.1 RNA polymerase sigma factor [Rossellomorea aquimaris]